ncbi:MAG TPA: segregation/condensation protein A [Solirubrobacteraceae bacterium]|nr:segregation/condensation protein A [Solirubrobacteraceae bacterium]
MKGPPAPLSIGALQLDLDQFSGPFDLLLTLVLREELDLLDFELAELVVAYLDHLDERGELDLESATDFIVLVAALLELKSRLLLGGEDDALDLEPAEAADELLERMLQAQRFRGAAAHLRALLAREDGVRFRRVPPPAALRRTVTVGADGSQDPAALGAAIGRLLGTPPPVDVRHIHAPRVSLQARIDALRALASHGSFDFDDAVRGADRMTVAVTLFALLELYRRGEVEWRQGENFGAISVLAAAPGAQARR